MSQFYFLFAFFVLLAIFLAKRRWIAFSITLPLFLVMIIISAIAVFKTNSSEDAFQQQIQQAVNDLKREVNGEKENYKLAVSQVQEIFDSIDIQKQKIQQFIEETKDKFKSDYSPKSSSTKSEENINHD